MPKRPKSSKSKRPSSLKSKEPDLNVKAASIEWGKDLSLLNQLLTLLEINKRWRHGIFAPSDPKDALFLAKDHYFVEIASALFSRHAHHRSNYLKRPFAFASAVKKKLESLPSKAKVGKTTRTNAYPNAWRSHQKEMIDGDCIPAYWAFTLPYELLRTIFQIAVRSDCLSGVDKILAFKFRLLNSTIYYLVTPIMFHTLTIRRNCHLKRFLHPDDNQASLLSHVRRIILSPGALTGHFDIFSTDPATFEIPAGTIHTLVLNFGLRYATDTALAHCMGFCRGMGCSTIKAINHPASKPEPTLRTTLFMATISNTLTTLDLPAKFLCIFWRKDDCLVTPTAKFGEAFDRWTQSQRSWSELEACLPFRHVELPMTIILRHTDVPVLVYASLVLSRHQTRNVRLMGWDGDDLPESWQKFTERKEFQSGSGRMFMGRLVRWDRDQ